MIFLNKNSHADIVRSTTFDDRTACEKSRGSWRDFGNSCADKCSFKFDKYSVCAYSITYGCDCGKNRCLHEDKCISINEYKKIYEENISKEQNNDNKIKEIRKIQAKKFENQYLNKLAGIYGVDPNYRDPNRYERERVLPPNTFKNTNRQLIYNHIIKKHNDKILQQQKIENKIAENNKNQNFTNDFSSNKLINYINNDNSVNQPKPSNDPNNKDKLEKNPPIVLKPIDDTKKDNENLDIDQKRDSFFEKLSKTPIDFISEANKIIKNENQQQNIENKNNDTNIPPVYVKQQNGETDFKNGDEINNAIAIPQFVN